MRVSLRDFYQCRRRQRLTANLTAKPTGVGKLLDSGADGKANADVKAEHRQHCRRDRKSNANLSAEDDAGP
jgi:hypothetical protein